MNITIALHEAVPVFTLEGRFDGYGASVFDERADAMDPQAASWILDLARVEYISSIGLRSLLRAEKRLRKRHGGLVLVGLSPTVRQVLDMVRMLDHLRTAGSVPDALTIVRAGSVAPDRADRRTRANRTCAFWPLAGESVLEFWGSIGSTAAPQPTADRLRTFSLEELGFAFGVGGFGATRAQAGEATGGFVTAGTLAGLLPSGAHGVADFLLPEKPREASLHVASALGIAGAPAFALEVSTDTFFTAGDLVEDLFSHPSEAAGLEPGVLALVAIVELAGTGQRALLVGVAADRTALARGAAGFDALADWLGGRDLAPGRIVAGRAVLLAAPSSVLSMSPDPVEAIRQIASLDALESVSEIDPAWRITSALAWGYRPSRMRDGREKLLAVEVDGGSPFLEDWETIARRLYRDCRRVVLTPLHGGYMSKTFRVASYDADNRRMLPTVLKIGGRALTAREEHANRTYVETFILNNSTTILGGASAGDWAGLRYNFLGVTGPDSPLTWLREHYLRRPIEEVLPLIDAVFTRILKPWYGQPRWESVALYQDHDPRRIFTTLCDVAGEVLGVPADDPILPCPELGVDLPNPYHFLKHEFPRRQPRTRLWYTSICHGDLNMQNILLDERENIYVIDFSETRPRNIVSDLARLEPIVKFEMVPLDTDEELRQVLEFERGLMQAGALNEMPPMIYPGANPAVRKAYDVIRLLRRHADTVTIFETDIVPYWLALLEWTLPVVAYVQLPIRQKKYAAYSAAMLCGGILERDPAP
jgi:anti-anti-sigma factor